MATPTLSGIKAQLSNSNIEVLLFKAHSKASEEYVEVAFAFPGTETWQGFIPLYHPASGLALEGEEEIARYLETIYPLFEPAAVAAWVARETLNSVALFGNARETKPFFDGFLSMNWVRRKYGLPDNDNHASRTRAIKKKGYTIIADTSRTVNGVRGHFYRLLPFPRNFGFEYEQMSTRFRTRTKRLLRMTDAYEYRVVPESTLLPDHKFPEIRWDEETRTENLDSLTDAEIVAKFQLLTNQRNQQKREMCRACFQTGKRGIIAGIRFFYEGDENWPADVPIKGKAAEQGCIGCGWHDIPTWRAALNEAVTIQGAVI